MGFFDSLKKIVEKANDNVNKVGRVVDPLGAYLKMKTETQSKSDLMNWLGGGSVGPVSASVDAAADESFTSVKSRKNQRLNQRRQGGGTGSTLLMTEDDSRLQGSTLLGE